MSKDAHQEVILITGGGGGIARDASVRFAAQGMKVAVVDLSADAAEATVAAIRAAGGQGLALPADVTDRAAVRDAVAAAERELGPLTIGIMCHGIGPMRPFLEFDDETWNQVISVNLNGSMIVGQEVARRMAERGYGRIVHLSSMSAVMPVTGMSAYGASKAGIDGLTRAMAAELGPLGITVNAIAPGPIKTELMLAMLDDEGRRQRIERIPVGRLGETEDISAILAFLVGRTSGFVNGVTLRADGGYSHSGPAAKAGGVTNVS